MNSELIANGGLVLVALGAVYALLRQGAVVRDMTGVSARASERERKNLLDRLERFAEKATLTPQQAANLHAQERDRSSGRDASMENAASRRPSGFPSESPIDTPEYCTPGEALENQ